MGATGLLATGYGLEGFASLASGYSNASAYSAQADYQKQQAETNARFADIDATEATRKGARDSQRVRNQAAQLAGEQRVGYAGQGVSVDSGSAAAAQDQAFTLGNEDADTVSNNAWREAFGYRVKADQYRAEGQMAEIAGKQKASSTLLTGGLQALGSFAKAGSYFGDGPSPKELQTAKDSRRGAALSVRAGRPKGWGG